ncbi:MAG: methyltransferase domain-containing protein, partial [Candidatus Heimdallarchaeota archaeon]
WFECDRRYITMTEHYIPHMKNKERAYSGSQMGLKKAFEKIIPKIQDDYLYRNEDIIYQELILKDGFKYGKVFDTFHYHEATNKKGEREPSFKDVIVEYYPNRDYDIKTYNMQSRGIIKYLSPKPYLIEEVNEPLKILQAHGALNIREFRKWVILNNSQWLDYLFFEKKESFMLKVLKKFRTLLIPIIDKIFNTKTQTSIIKKKVQSTKDDKKKMPQTQSNEIQKKILDVGCGTDKEPGAIGIDIANLPGVDIVQDLNVFPWGELEDESFDEIYMKDTIEHLDDPVGVMRECYRLLKDGGKLYVRVTYWNHKYSFSDPTHKHAFSEISFKFFVGEWRAYYMDFQFKNLNIDYIFDPNAIKKFGKNPKKLIEKAYFYCNIIQGMNITLTK